MTFGARIKEARKAKGYTQTQLAELIGVAKTTVSGYESGNAEPDEQRIIAIMKALDVDANFLWQDSIDFKPSRLASRDATALALAYDRAPENVQRSIRAQLEPYMLEASNAEIVPVPGYKPYLNDAEIEAEVNDYRRELELEQIQMGKSSVLRDSDAKSA